MLLVSSGNEYRIRRLLVSAANWKSPGVCYYTAARRRTKARTGFLFRGDVAGIFAG